MQDFSNQSFVYAGQKYLLSFNLYTNTAQHFSTHSLNNENVLQFEYTNSANELFLYGSVTYIDKYGIVDKYVEKQYTYMQILFSHVQRRLEEGVTTEWLDPENEMYHDFYVTKIEIKDRKSTHIVYKISIVSVNWLKLSGNITYSNYGRRPQTIIELIKAMLSHNKLNIDKKTFDAVKTNVKINYITNGNDNTLTAVKYLLSKLYYYDVKDTALKFIYYNDLKDQYCLFDIMNKETSKGITSLIISLFKTANENYTQELPVNMATVTQFPKSKSFKSIFNHEVFDYDYRHNSLIDKSIKTADILTYKNSRFPNDDFDNKFEPIFDTSLKYLNRGTYWNNCEFKSIYHSFIDAMSSDNAFVINVDGILTRKPGDFVNINVDRKLDYINDEEQESLDELAHRYKAFEGVWITAKVHHIVLPAAGKYRQNLVLFRNFIGQDISEQSAT